MLVTHSLAHTHTGSDCQIQRARGHPGRVPRVHQAEPGAARLPLAVHGLGARRAQDTAEWRACARVCARNLQK